MDNRTGVVVRPVDRPQADSIRVAYNRIRHCVDSIPDMFWPTRARVTGTKLRKPTGNSVSEAVIQTTDVTSGSRTVTSRLRMKKTEIELQRRNLKDSQVDPLRDDKEKEFVAERAPELDIWRSRLRPRNTGVVT